MSEGWIKLHRKIQLSDKYLSEPFCRNMAWVDLLLLANHDDKYFRVRGVPVVVKRGQCGYSIKKLSNRWKWSEGKVKRFLNELQNDAQIEQQNFNVTTLISIINYNQYQGDGAQISAQTDAQTARKQRADGAQTETNKNVKNVNNEKNVGNDPFFEMFRRVAGKHIPDTELVQEIAKFKNRYPNAHPNKSGALVNAWVGNIGNTKPDTGTKKNSSFV